MLKKKFSGKFKIPKSFVKVRVAITFLLKGIFKMALKNTLQFEHFSRIKSLTFSLDSETLKSPEIFQAEHIAK